MLNEESIAKEEQQWKIEKNLIKRKQKINREKAELNKTKKKLTTTKLLILFLFVNCTIIELFTGWTVVQSLQLASTTGLTPDFTPLVTLIGAVVGEVFGFTVYALKSIKENTVGGVVYDCAMQNNDVEGG